MTDDANTERKLYCRKCKQWVTEYKRLFGLPAVMQECPRANKDAPMIGVNYGCDLERGGLDP